MFFVLSLIPFSSFSFTFSYSRIPVMLLRKEVSRPLRIVKYFNINLTVDPAHVNTFRWNGRRAPETQTKGGGGKSVILSMSSMLLLTW
uniref:Putative secreted protein n=1 Tax=Anopheles darlingi TaxID=43151 RepID=A0A2M4DH99_ANODA